MTMAMMTLVMMTYKDNNNNMFILTRQVTLLMNIFTYHTIIFCYQYSPLEKA